MVPAVSSSLETSSLQGNSTGSMYVCVLAVCNLNMHMCVCLVCMRLLPHPPLLLSQGSVRPAC